MRTLKTFIAVAIGGLCGCQHMGGNCARGGEKFSETLGGYIELCKEVAVDEKPDKGWRDDWMVGAGVTSWERKSEYKIVYADAKYLSFRAEEYEYNGGAHGNTKITVGTLDRKTGRILRLADVVPEGKWPELTKILRAEVVKRLDGEANLQGEVRPIENFYVGKDGLHFVYNEYEVACYAAGAIEVVAQRISRPIRSSGSPARSTASRATLTRRRRTCVN